MHQGFFISETLALCFLKVPRATRSNALIAMVLTILPAQPPAGALDKRRGGRFSVHLSLDPSAGLAVGCACLVWLRLDQRGSIPLASWHTHTGTPMRCTRAGPKPIITLKPVSKVHHSGSCRHAGWTTIVRQLDCAMMLAGQLRVRCVLRFGGPWPRPCGASDAGAPRCARLRLSGSHRSATAAGLERRMPTPVFILPFSRQSQGVHLVSVVLSPPLG